MLYHFSAHLVARLVETGGLELVEGGHEQAVADLAQHLGRVQTGSLISSIVAGLMKSGAVDELHADDATIKTLVDGLEPSAARGGR